MTNTSELSALPSDVLSAVIGGQASPFGSGGRFNVAPPTSVGSGGGRLTAPGMGFRDAVQGGQSAPVGGLNSNPGGRVDGGGGGGGGGGPGGGQLPPLL